MKEIHGGDIYRHQVQLDFSVNTNPLGIPASVKQALHEAVEFSVRYPDIHAQQLKEKMARYLGVSKNRLLFGNGASELFLALCHALKPRKILLPVPSFYGYEYAANGVEAELLFYEVKSEMDFQVQEDFLSILTDEVDLVFLTNPNNPTGKLWEEGRLQRVLEHCQYKHITVVLDECFLDFVEHGTSMIDTKKVYPNVIVVRAFTKIFAIPGVRLGYLYCQNEALVSAIKQQLPEWNLSTFAQAAGCACLEEEEFIQQSKQYVKGEREFLEQGLRQLGVHVFSSDANFILIQSEEPLYEQLLEKGILIRDCSNFRGLKKGHYRIAVKTREENERLLKEMEEIKGVEKVGPDEIEKRSFEIISKELEERGIVLLKEQELITKRVIHTSADFEYASTMCYSDHAVEIAKSLLEQGAHIVTDTNMAYSGINKRVLEALGGEVHCFMADKDVARLAKERGVTRAAISMEKASHLEKPVIFAIGNAPTALVQLYEMAQKGIYRPAFIIGVPVGFVNVEVAKELILKTDIPCIINRGRKGGSNVAAAICNALLYQLKR